jgi:hypothetical protein
MNRRTGAFWTAGVALLLLLRGELVAAHTTAGRLPTAIVDVVYVDTSGEERDQSAAHRGRLERFLRAFRDDIANSGRFRVVPLACQPAPCSITKSEAGELLAAAHRSGTRLLLFGGIHKQSTLVQWANARIADSERDKLMFDRLLSFRGDDDAAWQHAEAFLSRELQAQDFGL